MKKNNKCGTESVPDSGTESVPDSGTESVPDSGTESRFWDKIRPRNWDGVPPWHGTESVSSSTAQESVSVRKSSSYFDPESKSNSCQVDQISNLNLERILTPSFCRIQECRLGKSKAENQTKKRCKSTF